MHRREVRVTAWHSPCMPRLPCTVLRFPRNAIIYSFPNAQLQGERNAHTCEVTSAPLPCRCHCPLPWVGYRCNRKLDCVSHHEDSGYSAAGGANLSLCTLDLNLTSQSSEFMACSCPVFGSFNILGIEAAQVRASR